MVKQIAVLLFLTGASLFAGPLYVNQIGLYPSFLGYGVGLANWTQFTSALEAAFGGAGNIMVSSSVLPEIETLNSYSALLVVTRDLTNTLSASEVTNLQGFISTGKPVVLLGENDLWSVWNNSILGTVGGSYSGLNTSATDTSVVNNALTTGVSAVTWFDDGVASGGTSLFQHNVATLWTPNVLTILSINVMDNTFGYPVPGNAQFDQNVVEFLAGPAVPEPSSLGLFALGLTGILMAWFKRG